MGAADEATTITIERAALADLDALLALYEDAARWLWDRGIPQWKPGAFPRDVMRQRLERGEVAVARSGAEIAGMVSLLDGVDQDIWGAYPADALYAHTVAVSRACAGRGIGGVLLDWAANETAARGKTALRLDCYAGNQTLNAYYQRAGFTLRGTMGEATYQVSLFEKRVSLS